MMIALPGFEIVTLLKAGVKAVIYRGIKVKDQCPVIIKALRPEHCTPNNMDHQQAIAVGFQLHISKPVDPEELVKAIVLLDL